MRFNALYEIQNSRRLSGPIPHNDRKSASSFLFVLMISLVSFSFLFLLRVTFFDKTAPVPQHFHRFRLDISALRLL